MKSKICFALGILSMTAVSQNNYISTQVPHLKTGINLPSAPVQYPLEVAGGIGMNFGDFIGIRDVNININQRRILQTGWDGTVGDFLTFFTPGTSGTINGLEKMRITNAGKVSIGGDPNPAGKLQVLENYALGQNTNDNKLIASFQCNVDGNNTLKQNIWAVRDYAGNNWYSSKIHDGISVDASFLTPGTTGNGSPRTWWERYPNLDIQAWGNSNITYMQLAQGKLVLNPSGAAQARLDVRETNGSFATIIARAHHSGGYGYCIRGEVTNDQTKVYSVTNNNYGNNGTNVKETFVVYGDGMTRIGIKNQSGTHANALLSVYGKAVATEIIVTAQNWADFVFDRDYKLPKLTEVEQYYQANKHLPLIPSAKEVEENGVNLGEMNKLLLQKVEELTIYMVDHSKRVERLEKENAELKALLQK